MNRVNTTVLIIREGVHHVSGSKLLGFPSTSSRRLNGINAPPNNKPLEPNGRAQRRQAMLNDLAALAKQATVGQKKLMLRVEYRKQR
jgi:hypothetical protein